MRESLFHNNAGALPTRMSYAHRSTERAKEVFSLLNGRVDLKGKVILDLGCGAAPLSEFFRQMSPLLVGLDKDENYVGQARKNSSLELVLADATAIPFRDQSFGFVLCNDVLEHIRDQAKLIQELLRVLRHDGAAYIQCANKYQIIEPHFLLPFLSWVPRPLANVYVKITRKGKSYEEHFPRPRNEVVALVRGHRVVDLTFERTLMKIEDLNIRSKTLLRVVSAARRILSNQSIAGVAQNFSIVAILIFKD